MNQNKTGQLIRTLRNEKSMTQTQLADIIHVSNKTISKWERGQGLPDVSLLNDLSRILGVNAEKILSGDLSPSSIKGGNMKKIKFYVCQDCGNIITATGDAEVSCCGRKLEPLKPQKQNAEHKLVFEEADDEYYIHFNHEMNKSHYLNFIAWVNVDRVMLVHLYPEQGGEVRLPKNQRGNYYFGCSKHGLFLCDKIQ